MWVPHLYPSTVCKPEIRTTQRIHSELKMEEKSEHLLDTNYYYLTMYYNASSIHYYYITHVRTKGACGNALALIPDS